MTNVLSPRFRALSVAGEPQAVGFLDGVRVIDATRLLPGGLCTMLLSDMGAEVIKVEQPGLGDYMRATPPTKDGRSPVHATVNRNKLSIGIDLKAEAGKGILRKLVKGADVFVEGFRPGAMRRLGFGFDDVKRVNPRIVYCSISTYGQGRQMSAMPGHDINFQAMAGTLGYSARPDVPLLQLGDLASGMYAALGILGALVRRRGAVYVDVPIVPSLASWMIIPASAYLATGRPPTRGHSLVFGSTPYYNLYRSSDGKYMAVAAIEERFWRNLLGALGAPELEQMRFGTPKERRYLDSQLRRIFSTKTRDEWAKILMHGDTCATPVLTVEEALTSQWAKTSSLIAKAAKEPVINGPIRTSPPARDRPFTRAPGLGDDTFAIMKGLGYSRKETLRLRRAAIVE